MSVPKLLISQITFQYIMEAFSPSLTPNQLPFWLQLQWERMRKLFNVLYHWEQEELVLCSLPASPGSGGDHHRLIGQAEGAAGPWLMQIALNIWLVGIVKQYLCILS